ncbi:MAG: CotH kinase family protein [Bauldia sp.]|nr:CotH kinase family protein [Bauldia sp.]
MAARTHRPLTVRGAAPGGRLARLGTSVAVIAILAVMAQASPASAQATTAPAAEAGGAAAGGPQFNIAIGGPTNERREIVAQFDTDGDGVLDAAERATARAWLADNPANTGPGGAGGPGQFTRRIGGPDGVQPAFPGGPNGGPPGFGGPQIFGGGAGTTTTTEPTGPLDDATVNEALRVAVTNKVADEFGMLPAEAQATVVTCIVDAAAVLPTADRQLLVDTGFDPSEEQIARLEANVPGIEATVRACFPQFAAGGPGGGRDFVIIGGPGGEAQATETGTTGIALTPADVENYAGTALYDTSVIRTIFLEFGTDDWEQELEDFYNTDVQIPVAATVDSVAYEDVGVRFRGNTSFMMTPAGLKRPIRLKFDFIDENQNVEGYRTLNLHNGIGDPGFLHLPLYSYIANQYIAAPKVNYVRLVVDGENWGIYANQQHFNRDFVEDYFGYGGDGVRWQVPGSPGARGGMEYLGDDIEQYRSIYEIDNRDNDESWNALIAMFKVLNETPVEGLVEALDPILDIDGALRFLALEVVFNNSDGFYARASDYYIYLDPAGRFHVAPHDMNETFSQRNVDPLIGLDDATKPLRSKLLAVPELRARYLEYVLDIATNWLDWDTIGPVATAYHDLIDADMAQDTRKLFSYDAFANSLTALQAFVEARRENLLATVPDLIAAIPLTDEERAANAAARATPAPGARIAAANDAEANAAPAAGVTALGTTTATFAGGEGPEGWTIAAGEGGALVTSGEATYFAFSALAQGFGDNKLDQCVAIDADQPLEIAYTVFANVTDPTGLSLRVNPTFFATPADCLAAVAADDSDAALDGDRADEDLDFALGAGDGLRLVTRTAADDAALAYAMGDIPAGATTMRLSVRARDRSDLAPAPTLGIAEVTVTQAGAQFVANPGFTGAPAP